jgi:hypothetical protein
MHEPRRLALQQDLISLCEERWLAMRGPEPKTPPLRKAIMVMATCTRRSDLVAVLEIISLLAASRGDSDAALETLREALAALGICFFAVEDDQARFTRHGHGHKAATFNQAADILFEIRQLQLG